MNVKKLTAVFLATLMILSLSLTSLAAYGDGTGTITVKNVGDSTLLNVHQILTYSYNETTENYYNVVFTDSDYAQVFVDAIADHLVSGTTAPNVADTTGILLYITNNLENDPAFARTLADLLEIAIGTATPYASKSAADEATNGAYVFEGVETGYYLILDKTSYTHQDSAALAMLQPMNPNIVVTLKTDSYTIPVKESDNNDGSVKVGDVLTYTISIEIPNFSTYTDVKFIITDTMSIGLVYNDDLTFKLNGADYTLETGDIAAFTGNSEIGTVLTVTFADIKTTFADDIGKTLVLSYTATVDEHATADGLTNAVVATQNNTIFDGNTVTVDTYGFKIFKYNEHDEKLKDVEFKLIKTAATDEIAATYHTFTLINGIYVLGNHSVDASETLKTDENGMITVWGLDEGTYELEETKPLDGYNSLTSTISIVIDANNANDENYMTYIIEEEIIDYLGIINYTGILIPGTGGMGTAMFTVLGTMVTMGSGTLLVANRKRFFK